MSKAKAEEQELSSLSLEQQAVEVEKHVLKTCRLEWFLVVGLTVLFFMYAQSFYISGEMKSISSGVLNTIYITTIFYFLVAVFGVDRYKNYIGNQVFEQKLSFNKGLQRLALSQIAKYSLLEACAINGLVLAVLQQDISASYGFLILAFVGLFWQYPLADRVFSGFPQIQARDSQS